MTGPDLPTAGRFEGAVHLLPVRVYYEDTDFTGVVYHANYLRYFERARSDFLRLAGISHQALLADEKPTAFAVARIAVDYKRPARVDDALVVRTSFTAPKGPLLPIFQRLTRGDDILVEASVQACCIDLNGRPKRPPAMLVEALRPLLDLSDRP